jgi:hypothetical protein
MHIGDLDRVSASQGSNWTATVTIAVHNSSHNGVTNATMSGSWDTGGTGSCTTSASGQRTVSKSGISKKIASVTFTVANGNSSCIACLRTYFNQRDHNRLRRGWARSYLGALI